MEIKIIGFLKAGSHCVTLADSDFSSKLALVLPQPPNYWHFGLVPPCPVPSVGHFSYFLIVYVFVCEWCVCGSVPQHACGGTTLELILSLHVFVDQTQIIRLVQQALDLLNCLTAHSDHLNIGFSNQIARVQFEWSVQ